MRLATRTELMLLTLSAVLVSGAAGGASTSCGEVIKEMLATMDKLTAGLSSIKDEATAKAATPQLRKSAASWLQISKKAEKIKPPTPEEAAKLRKEFKEKLETAQRKLFHEIGRVKGVPGGKEALQEISALLGKNAPKGKS